MRKVEITVKCDECRNVVPVAIIYVCSCGENVCPSCYWRSEHDEHDERVKMEASGNGRSH